MTDIQRLRRFGDDTTLGDAERVLIWDACDEIERLRAEIRTLRADMAGGEP